MTTNLPYCGTGQHDWSETCTYVRDGHRIEVEACLECCATRVTVPNGSIDIFTELHLEESTIIQRRRLWLVEDEA